MRLGKFRPGWPLILLGSALQGWAVVALGIAVGVVLDYLGVAGARETGGEEALLWAAAFLLVSGLFAVGGTVVLRNGTRRG
jgi:hypothetical protein